MGCTTSRTVSEEQKFCEELYGFFTKGEIPKIIEAAADGATMTFPEGCPYSGVYTKGDKTGNGLVNMFENIGKAWGGEKGRGVKFTRGYDEKGTRIVPMPEDLGSYETKDGKTTCSNWVIQLCPGGAVVSGIEKHCWEIDLENKKFKSMVVSDTQFHNDAFDKKVNQSEILSKTAWKLFSIGDTDTIIDKLQNGKGTFSVGGEEAAAAGVPYGGVWVEGGDEKKSQKVAFQKMMGEIGQSLMTGGKFEVKEGGYSSKDSTVTMAAVIKVKNTAGKSIEGEETHVCVTEKVDGLTVMKDWTVTGVEHHIAAYKAA